MAHFTSDFVRTQTEAGVAGFNWQGGHLVWRALSAFFDIGTIFVVFLLGLRLHNKWAGLIAAMLYACAPLAIEKSHFGTVNAIAGFLVTIAVLFATVAQDKGRWWAYLGFGIACGAAVASRINTAPLAGVIVLAALVRSAPVLDRHLPWSERQRLLISSMAGVVFSGIVAFVSFRIFNPYAFEGPSFFGIFGLNQHWLDNISSGSYGVSGYQDSPPNWQWLGRPSYIYPLKDMWLWGMGIAFGIVGWFAWAWAGARIVLRRPFAMRNIILVVWIAVYFAWMGRLWVMTMRYYLPLYGCLAVLAGWALTEMLHRARDGRFNLWNARFLLGLFAILLGAVAVTEIARGEVGIMAFASGGVAIVLAVFALIPALKRQSPKVLTGFVLSFSLLWVLMYTNIYRNQLTRVQGARWLMEQAEGDFAMRVEGAPEGTPLINIAIRNNGNFDVVSEQHASLFQRANTYVELAPYLIDFIAPADGTIHEIVAPHLGDPLDDPDNEILQISIATEGVSLPLVDITLEQDFPRDEHPLGRTYVIPIEPPLQVTAGQSYTFKVEALAGGGPIMGSGSVVLTEGDWDDRLTVTKVCQLPNGLTSADEPSSGLVGYYDCNGTEGWTAHFNSYDQAMSYPIDNQIKLDSIIDSLNVGDYLAISSNRFYDTVSRNPLRFPLSTRYYELLFSEELGYELIAQFDETYEWGPFRVSDQHLPTYDSPAWLNEFEADEAFHVYDHPAVFIFKKTDDYDAERVRLLLEGEPIYQMSDILVSYVDPTIVNVVQWASIDADQAPTALQLPNEVFETQTEGGTWSERFQSESPLNNSQIIGVAVWWVAIIFFGWITFPMLYRLFPKMADRGYGVAKFVGLLVVSWLAWVMASLKVPLWSREGVLLMMLLVTVLSYVMIRKHRAEFVEFIRTHWKRLFAIEVITLIAFIVFIAVRLTNPDLWHFAKGGEKPMDFAYFNAVLRSTVFPPIDPWYAGGYINYYYFGFVLVGSPVLLLGIVPSFAYNLIIPTLFAITGIGAFSVAFNLVSSWKERPWFGKRDGTPRRLGNPWVAGIAALMLCVVMGNLDTIRVVGNGIAKLGGYNTPLGLKAYLIEEYKVETGIFEIPPEVDFDLGIRAEANHLTDRIEYEIYNATSLVGGLLRGTALAIGGETLPIGSDRWYWGPSRVLAETAGVEGNAITEMPYFTFLYGDLHAHMINMPVLLFIMLFLFNELLLATDDPRSKFERFLTIAIGALAVGLVRATNTWDYPSFLIFAIVGMGYAWWVRWRHTMSDFDGIGYWLVVLGGLGAGFVVFSLALGQITPAVEFGDALSSVLGAGRLVLLLASVLVAGWIAVRWIFNRASAVDFLTSVIGFTGLSFLFVLPYSTWYAATYNSISPWTGGKTPLWAYFDIHGLFLFLIVSLLIWETWRWLNVARMGALRGTFNWLSMGLFGAGVLTIILLGVSALDYQVALITVPLILWIAVLFFRPNQSRAMQFVLVLVGFALALTLGVEFIVIDGDIGRQNTVFKFYIQAWLLLSVAGGTAFAWLLDSADLWSRKTRLLWFAPLIILTTIAAMYPFMATRGRAVDRMAPDTPLTLDGMDYMQYATHYESNTLANTGETIDLSVDYAIIRWLHENVEGSPVIIEGRRAGSEYHWNGRIAINTGLPSVLGWNHHQRQQRTFDPLPRLVDQRAANIMSFYDSPSIEDAVQMLRFYDIQYIIVSGLEAVHASAEGLAKFDDMVEMGLLSLVFEEGVGKIYQVNPADVEAFSLGE